MKVFPEKSRFLYSCPSLTQMKNLGSEVAFLGRSNSGKSSLINALIQKNLAKTSKMPGRTKHAVVFGIELKQGESIKEIILVDLPGFGYASMSKVEALDSQKIISHYIDKRKNLIALFLLVDIRRTLDEREMQVINTCLNRKITLFLVLTKADKLSKSKLKPLLIKLSKQTSIKPKNILLHTTYDIKTSEKIRENIFELVNGAARETRTPKA